MRKCLLPLLLLVAAIWFLYAQTATFEFLRFDDHDYTFRCAFVFDGLSWENIRTAFSNFTHAAIWMPATYLSYMVDISLFGPGAGPHHLANVLYHTLSALALFFLIRRLFPARPAIAGLAAFLWALHPQRAEAVAWIAGRKDVLCGLFTLLSLHCWLGRKRLLPLLASYLFAALACLCKPAAMCLPFLLWIVERLAPPDDAQDRPSSPLLPLVPVFLMAAATGDLAVYSQTHAEGYATRELFSASFPWRLLNAAVATGLDLFQTLVPLGIYLDYRAVPGAFPLQGALGLAALLACAAGLAVAICRNRKNPLGSPVLLAALWFLVALAPTLGIFGSFGEHARADRFLYIPSLAFPLLLAAVLSRTDIPRPRLAFAALSLFALFVFGASIPVVAAYRNDYTVFSRTLAFDPDHGRALAHVASEECARLGQIDKGIAHYRRSQELRPRDDTAAQLAYALMMRGASADYPEIRRLCAKFACDHSLDAKGMALEALGTTAMRQRKWKEAISCLEDSVKAPRRFYSPADAQLRLATCYANAQRTDEAIRLFQLLVQSKRTDIANQARQALATLRANPNSLLFF